MIITPADMIQSRKMFSSWETIPFPATAVAQGANAPTWDTTFVGWDFDDAPPNNQEIQMFGHAPFSWRIGSRFYAGLHFYLTNAGAAGEDVKWDFLYRGANPGGVFPAGWTTLTRTIDVSSYAVRQDVHVEFTVISGAGLTFATMMDMRLQRDTADAADDHPHPVILKMVEIHYQKDSFGAVDYEAKWG